MALLQLARAATAGSPRLPPRYSFCMLCYNDAVTVEASIGSLLELRRKFEMEVVVVDNKSKDGSWEALQRFSGDGVRIISRRCSRGVGRQLAFANSTGTYVVAQVDCDDVFSKEGMLGLLSRYESEYEGLMMMTRRVGQDERQSITVAPRSLVETVGGWRDMNWGEDWDLWNRTARLGRYSFLPYPTENPPHKSVRVRSERETSTWTKFSFRYQKGRDAIRVGRRSFSEGEEATLGQRVPIWLASLSVALTRSRLEPAPLNPFDDTAFRRRASGQSEAGTQAPEESGRQQR